MPAVRTQLTPFFQSSAPAYLVLVFCIVFAGGLIISTYPVFNQTWDEPEHLAAGLALLDSGEYPYDVQHPPLARLAMAVGPYLAGARSYHNAGPSGDEEGRDILYQGHDTNKLLSLARAGILPFVVVLFVATWLWAAHIFGRTVAALATVFLATTPPLLGHAGLATLDLPVTAMLMLALYCFQHWRSRPGLHRAAVFGITAGLAAATKLSAIPFLGITFISWYLAAQFSAHDAHPPQRQLTRGQLLRHALVAFLLAVVSLTLCYGWHWAAWSAHLPIPAPVGLHRFIDSLVALNTHNASGHLAYFMGEVSDDGWWEYYLVVVGVKSPLPLLLLGLVGSVWSLQKAWRSGEWTVAAPALSLLAILAFSSAYSQINIGVRHVLIVFPLLAILAGFTLVAAWHQWRTRLPRTGLVLLLVWQIASVRAQPDNLAYFNELAGRQPERIVVDSDLDWGQDIRRLAAELKRRQIDRVSVLYRGSADLTDEHLPEWHRLKPRTRTSGWIAVSLFARYTTRDRNDYAWLDEYQPVTRVGTSFDLYYIPAGTTD